MLMSKKLLAGGIFCDLVKVFDYIDQDNLLSYLLTYLLTPWSRVFLEMLTGDNLLSTLKF